MEYIVLIDLNANIFNLNILKDTKRILNESEIPIEF